MIPGAVSIGLAIHLQTFPGSDVGVDGSGDGVVVGGGRHSVASVDYWWVAVSVVPGQF